MKGFSSGQNLDSLSQPDTILPAEFYGTVQRKRSLVPGYGLMLAVLENAISCFQKHLFARNRRGRQLFREAEEWILEENSDWIFSFENICDGLRLNPKYIRRELLRWKEKTEAKYRKVGGSRPHVRGVADRGKACHRFYRWLG